MLLLRAPILLLRASLIVFPEPFGDSIYMCILENHVRRFSRCLVTAPTLVFSPREVAESARDRMSQLPTL